MDVLDGVDMKPLSNDIDIKSSPIEDDIYDEHYFKPHLFGMFNQIFSTYINNSMDKFPLEFSFEGAFYRAWHIGKKQYLG